MFSGYPTVSLHESFLKLHQTRRFFFVSPPDDERPVDHKMDEEADKVSCLEVEVFWCF